MTVHSQGLVLCYACKCESAFSGVGTMLRMHRDMHSHISASMRNTPKQCMMPCREYNRADTNSKRNREREDRDRLRAIEREERDRRRVEVMHAKRYPIDDLDLIAEQRYRSSCSSGSSSMPFCYIGDYLACLTLPAALTCFAVPRAVQHSRQTCLAWCTLVCSSVQIC